MQECKHSKSKWELKMIIRPLKYQLEIDQDQEVNQLEELLQFLQKEVRSITKIRLVKKTFSLRPRMPN